MENQSPLETFKVAELKRIWEKWKTVSVRQPKKSNLTLPVISNAHHSGNPISESSDVHAQMVDDQAIMHKGALGEESGEQALDVPQGDKNGGQHDCQTSDMAFIILHVWNLNKCPEIVFVTLVSPRREESTCAVDQMTS